MIRSSDVAETMMVEIKTFSYMVERKRLETRETVALACNTETRK